MDFGLFIPCHRLDDSVTQREVMERAIDTAKLAEEAGFTTVWFPEHHMIQYIACPSPLMLAIKVAAHTKRIRVGTAIMVLPYYDPRRLAGEIGLADILTEGRLELGFGRGAFKYEFERFGIDEHSGAARLRENLEVLHGLLTQEEFEYQGETVSFGPSTAVPRPLQQPHPPIWIAARSRNTVQWGLERGYHQIATPWREPFERVADSYAQFTDVKQQVQPATPPKYAVSRMSFVGNTDGEALQAMRVVRQHHRIWTRLFTGSAEVHGGFVVPDPVADEYSEERLFDHLVAGSPERCIEKLRHYERLGVDHYIMYAGLPMDHTATMHSIELFADRVMPSFTNKRTHEHDQSAANSPR